MGRKKITEKRCPRCGIVKPRSEYYEYNAKGRKSKRIDSRCKACSLEAVRPARKRWFEKNRETALERLHEWRDQNKERLKQYQYEYNKQGIKELNPSSLNRLFKQYTGLDP